MITDSELLRRYGESHCETAFTQLVQRYLDFVYSAARRQVGGDAHLARDVAQRVFIDLAQKANSLSPDTLLTGWLYTRTRYAAAKAVRTERRWRAREEKACMDLLSPQATTLEPSWEELQPLLDTAMHALNERDRAAVLLRYFEGRSLAEVGAKLGLTEDAARMRLGRALDKLRQLLARRGITSTTAGLAALLAQQTVTAAPAGLALNIAGTALACASTATTTVTLTTIMAAIKTKIALVGAAVIALATPLALQQQSNLKLRAELQSLRLQNQQLAALAADNARLSNLLAAAQAQPVASPAPSPELLKLRGEVARLREDSRELADIKTIEPSPNDPSIHATAQTLAARATQLKRQLEERPHNRIPELQLVSDKHWLDAVAKHGLDTDSDIRDALRRLRNSAKTTLGGMMQKALREYAGANGGRLPADILELQPYFNPPVDPAMLERYQLVQTGSLEDTPPNASLIAEVAAPVDDEFDTRFEFTLNGDRFLNVSRVGDALRSATVSYANANNGFLPRSPGDLLPYLQQPVPPERVQKYITGIPPNIKTLDQMRKSGGG